jgi:hypothetical protein
MMAPDPPPSVAEVKSNNQLAAGMPKAGGGWRESVDDHTATTVGDDEQRERARDDEGNDEDCKGGKGDGDNEEGAGQQGGQGWQGPWRWQ